MEKQLSMTEALSEAFKLGRDYEQHLPQPTDAKHDALGEWASEELA